MRSGYAAVRKDVSYFFLPFFFFLNFCSKVEDLLQWYQKLSGYVSGDRGQQQSTLPVCSGHLIARERMRVASMPINTL